MCSELQKSLEPEHSTCLLLSCAPLFFCWVIAHRRCSLTSHMTATEQSTRNKHSQPRKSRAGALVTHHPAWVGHHTGGSWTTPTVHPCPLRWEGVGGSTALSTPKLQQHVQQQNKNKSFGTFLDLFPIFFMSARCYVAILSRGT